ncbi:carboxylate--amine ligase [Dictyobacter kobayashii]|uniref:ATP-grasp domain-containing protein n=1 Tax=Dictyobacter kobayashii TaxID=2014872 RepID=A0A402AE69_9CHLR|nr:ATP-grasp domain-containing protein [Dictyobacter kobayashii]GCE17391.1 hypothetical protein KDK_11910 [Dictyobacter kobayashii]
MPNSLNNSDLQGRSGSPVSAATLSEQVVETGVQPPTYDALVLDANLRQSLVAVRSLGQRGMHVAALETSPNATRGRFVPTFSSRWCEHAYVAPGYDHQTESYLTYLHQVLAYTGARVLLTSSDGTLAVIREHRAEIEKYTRIALAKEPALEAAINKDVTLAIAERLGLGIPRGVTVSSTSEVKEAIREIGLPAVVKPIETWLWGEQQGVRLICELVTTPDEAYQAVEKLTQFGGSTLFQQFLTGRREAISLLYGQGTFYARFAQWAKRTQPPLGGTSVLRQSIAIPDDIGQQSERLVREIELEGYSEVEFRRDDAGKPYLMEINPRLSASVEIAVRSGIDFPYLLYQWAAGELIKPVEGYQAGGWMRFLEGDIVTTAEALAQRGRPGVPPPTQTILQFCSSFFTPTGYDYVDWKDLKPVWSAAKDFSYRSVRKLRKRPSGRN